MSNTIKSKKPERNMIRVTSMEEIQVLNYHGDPSEIKNAVNGGFSGGDIPIADFRYQFNGQKEATTISAFCLENNDDIGVNEFSSINALIALMTGCKSWGNVVLLLSEKDQEGESFLRGFTEEETAELIAFLNQVFSLSEYMIKGLHQRFDNEYQRHIHFAIDDDGLIFRESK